MLANILGQTFGEKCLQCLFLKDRRGMQRTGNSRPCFISYRERGGEFVFVSHHGPLARLYIMGFGVKTCREAAGTGRTLCVFHSASDIMTTETWSCIDRFHLDGFLASFDTHCVHVRGEVITISGTVVEWKKQ